MESHVLSDSVVKAEIGLQLGEGLGLVKSRETWLRAAVRKLTPPEMFMLVFGGFLVVVALAASSLVLEWPQVILRMLALSCVILGMSFWSSVNDAKWLRVVKTFYVAPLIPIYFKTTELISYSLHGHDFDSMLVATDRILFGGANPTVWLFHHIPVMPGFVEYLQICYSLFYFLPILLAAELYRRMSVKEELGIKPVEKQQIQQLLFVIVYGFMLSYAAYFLFPSVGPRFTLHDFFSLDRELPGVFLTSPIRSLLNRGENVIAGMSLAQVRSVVTRDAFPSGHTDLTLLTMVLAFNFRAKSRWIILVLGSSLIFSTVYLRYHYVIDVIGGGLFAMITLASWQWMRARMESLRSSILAIL